MHQFQSTLPLRGATSQTRWRNRKKKISIHTPLAGSDIAQNEQLQTIRFQSTLPLRGATYMTRRQNRFNQFQSTLPLRGATRMTVRNHRDVVISIHTPLAGSDLHHGTRTGQILEFQSTLPLRGATDCIPLVWREENFNPHSPCGERRDRMSSQVTRERISIHTPLAGSDPTALYHD